jgi:hypothetical protein
MQEAAESQQEWRWARWQYKGSGFAVSPKDVNQDNTLTEPWWYRWTVSSASASEMVAGNPAGSQSR